MRRAVSARCGGSGPGSGRRGVGWGGLAPASRPQNPGPNLDSEGARA